MHPTSEPAHESTSHTSPGAAKRTYDERAAFEEAKRNLGIVGDKEEEYNRGLALLGKAYSIGMTLILVVFYTLLGVIGKSIDFLNIVLYFVAVFFALWIENKQYKTTEKEVSPASSLAFSILLIFTLFFFIFTFWSPDIGLFWEVTRVC